MEKLYGVFEISYRGYKGYREELATQKIWEALRVDGIRSGLGFSTDKRWYLFNSKEEALRKARDLRWYYQSNETSRGVIYGMWHRRIVVHEVSEVIGGSAFWKLSKKDLAEARESELYKRIKAEKEVAA